MPVRVPQRLGTVLVIDRTPARRSPPPTIPAMSTSLNLTFLSSTPGHLCGPTWALSLTYLPPYLTYYSYLTITIAPYSLPGNLVSYPYRPT